VSVHPERTRDGRTIYRVRWRQAGRGTADRSRTFDHENDAIDFDRRVRRLKQTGDPALLADEMTLRQYVYAEWWPNYVERRLALSTQEGHSIDLELRIVPRLGHLPLTQLRPSVIERFAADLEREGTGRATIVRTLAVLQGVMKRAVRDYNLPSNPVKQIDSPLSVASASRSSSASSRSRRFAAGAGATVIFDLRRSSACSRMPALGPNPKRCRSSG
jgi:hypothetical protein